LGPAREQTPPRIRRAPANEVPVRLPAWTDHWGSCIAPILAMDWPTVRVVDVKTSIAQMD
jgi:hypothetical protein